MTIAEAATNGHAPVRSQHDFDAQDKHLADVLSAEVDDLRTLLDDELKGRDQLVQLLERSRERERRLTRAIAVLDGGVQQQQQASAKPSAKQSKGKKSGWDVSDATVKRVRVAFMRHWEAQSDPQPFTMTVLAAEMAREGQGIGGETIRRAMDRLRQLEMVRVCGTTRGGGKLWAPMPGAVTDAD